MLYTGTANYNEEFWAAEAQKVFHVKNVAVALSKTNLGEIVKSGDTWHKPFRSHLYAQTYTKGTDITVQDISTTDDYGTVNTTRIVPIYIDDIDELQNKYTAAVQFGQDAGRILSNVLDQAVLAERSNAASVIVNSDMGGSDSSAFTLNSANVDDMFFVAARKLQDLDVEDELDAPYFAVIGPRTLETLRKSISDRETVLGDTVGENGLVGVRGGFKLYKSNNCPYSATWTPAANPGNTQTITINGITLTFKTTIANAGDILIGGTTAVTLDNLVACINQTGTAGTDYVALSDAGRWKFTKRGIAATDGTTYMSIAGFGDIVVATSDSADPWSSQIQYSLLGLTGATELVIQRRPNMQIKDHPNRLGKNIFTWTHYGIKTFADMKDALVSASINASAWL